VRADFAEQLRDSAGLRSPALVRAFATVPRERFLGPGPWKILVPTDLLAYRDTPDDDPRHLYQNVLVAIDASLKLNNGEPAALARWLDALDLTAGERFLHLGCGVGYYTAVVAEVVSAEGSVVGVEIDARLAERAQQNLAGYANVTVIFGDGRVVAGDSFDAIFVNAGVTEIEKGWVEQLRPGGRLVVPMTTAIAGMNAGMGAMLLVNRLVGRPVGRMPGRLLGELAARFFSPVGIYHCAGGRTDEGDDLLARAHARRGAERVRSLRYDQHQPDSGCWLHAPRFCLSEREIDPEGSAGKQSS